MIELTYEPIGDSFWLVAAIILGSLLIVWGVRPWGANVSAARWRALRFLRYGALVVLWLALLRPALIRTDNRPAAATLSILVDNSRSMTLPHGDSRTRWEVATSVIERLGQRLQEFDDELDVQFFGFSDSAQLLSDEALRSFGTEPPTGAKTDLGLALRTALTSAAGRPLAGVVLVSDGTSTVSGSNPAVNARTLASLEVPLWTIGVGPRQADQTLRDCAIEELPESYQVFTKNLFRVTATVKARGLRGTSLPITLTLVDAQGKTEELASRTVTPNQADAALPVEIELPAPAAGSYQLVLAAAAQSGETLVDNNQQIAFLDVRDGGGRILYLEGEPRYEQLYLRRSLNDSADLELSHIWIDRASSDRWPVNLGDAVNPGQYDAIIIGDVHADALGQEALQKIVDRVNEGTGFLMIGGLYAFDAGGYGGSPLAALLPVRMDSARRVAVRAEPPASTQLPSPVALRPTGRHPITQFGAGDNDDAIWRELKPLLGANRFLATKVSPGVEVLLQSDREEPLLVVGQYGKGRTAAFAGDSTWQWVMQGKGDVHRRFWRQLLLWMLNRDAPEPDAFWITMEARRFERQNPASFSVGIQSLAPVDTGVALRAQVLGETGEPTVVKLDRRGGDAAGGTNQILATGQLPELPGGLYRLLIDSPDSEPKYGAGEMSFQVIDRDVELSQPVAEISRLEQLATLTESAGGRSFRTDEVDSLIEQIRSLRQKSVLPVVEKYRLGDDWLSGWLLTLVFVGMLGSEWYLRKRWGLA
jgi:uncharacterized membrane protein